MENYLLFLLFTTFISDKCPFDSHYISSLAKEFKIVPVQDMMKCLNESKWLWCRKFFPPCLHNNQTKKFEYIPYCQETCFSYTDNRPCGITKKFFETLYVGLKNCPDILGDAYSYNCSTFPRRRARKCLYKTLGKSSI